MMVLFDPLRKWASQGVCRWEERDLFFADCGMWNRKPSRATQAKWDQAKDICSMCPVMEECRRDTLGEPYGVFGGRDQHERFLIRQALTKAVKTWPRERQLAWGKALYDMRQEEVGWKEIQTTCGIPETPAKWLVRFWQANMPKEQPQTTAEIVDLELPSLEEAKTPFPDKPGQRDAWVRNNGLVADGWYRGETADGAFLNITVFSGRGQVHKWFPKDDVQLYRPQAVVVLSYSGHISGGAMINTTKTHCPQGHAYDEANTHYDKRGYRVCRACRAERSRANRVKKRSHAAAESSQPQLQRSA